MNKGKSLMLAIILPFTYFLFQDVLDYLYNIVYIYFGENSSIFDSYYFFDTFFCIIVSAIYYIWYKRMRVTRIGWVRKRLTPIRVLKLIVIGFGICGISYLWLTFVEKFMADGNVMGLGDSYESFSDAFSDIDSTPYIWVFLSVILFGPLCEELLFRGLQYNYLKDIKAGWFPIIISAIAFGIWHGEPVQTVYTISCGIALAIVYRNSESLIETFIVHFVNNLLSSLPPKVYEYISWETVDKVCVMMIIPSLILLYFMIRENKSDSEREVDALSFN